MANAVVTPATYLNNYATLNSTLATDNFVKFGTTDNATVANRYLLDLTTAEANATTGSAPKLYWALAQMIHRSMNYIPDATNPTGNTATPRDSADATNASAVTTRKSAKMSASQSMSTDNTSGTPVITQTFVFTFTLGATGGLDVTAD
jgi:hypothetical protein